MDELFSAISACQQLYPDTDLSSEEGEEGEEMGATLDENNFYNSAAGLPHLTEEGLTVLQHLENICEVEMDGDSIKNGAPVGPCVAKILLLASVATF